LADCHADVASGATGALWLLLAVGLMTGLAVWLDTAATTSLLAERTAFGDRGADTWIIQAPGLVDGLACDRLAGQPGVRAAGALSQRADGLAIAQLPGNPATWYSASPGFADVLPQSTGQLQAGPLLSTELAGTLNRQVGQLIVVEGQAVPIGGTYVYDSSDGRPPGLGYALITVEPAAQAFDQCWLDLTAYDSQTRDLLYTAVRLSGDGQTAPPQLLQHNSSLGPPPDWAARWRGRPTAWLWAGAAAAGAVIAGLACWRRRLEHASALHHRQAKSDQVAQIVLETLSWAVPAVAASGPLIAGLTAGLPAASRRDLALSAAAIPAASLAGTILGALAGALGVRQRRLFAYFKNR
jgi:hypothetical protein